MARSRRSITHDRVGGQRVSVYDNGGKTADRYTIVLDDQPERGVGMYAALGLSAHPSHPQGFSQFTSAMKGSHLGKKIRFASLPKNVRDHARARLS